ncbi:MAG: TRAP transporter substrate-binding protein DctP [Thermodesulfobacteriota bacterium]
MICTRRNLNTVWGMLVATIVMVVLLSPVAYGGMKLKISHQFAEGDVRDQLAKVFVEKITQKLGTELEFRIYPASSLFKPKEQWDAMRQGTLDFSVFPLDYAAGKVPELSITLLPCSVMSLKQAMSWQQKPIGKRISKILEDNGVKDIVWAWLDGGIGSSVRQIKAPDDAKGVKLRAAGKKFEFMFKEAGASITSMPSSEIYHALSTGVLDTCLTSSSSFVSYRLYEQLKFMNAPRDYAIWFMAEPLVISMKTWNRLKPEQRKVIEEVGTELERDWIIPNFMKDNENLVKEFSKAGVQLHYMTKEEFEVWREFAKKTAWKNYEETVPKGKEILDLAIKAME